MSNVWTMVKKNNELVALASTLRNACLIAARVPGSVIENPTEDVNIANSRQISLNCFDSNHNTIVAVIPAKEKQVYRAALKALRAEYSHVNTTAAFYGLPVGKVIF